MMEQRSSIDRIVNGLQKKNKSRIDQNKIKKAKFELNQAKLQEKKKFEILQVLNLLEKTKIKEKDIRQRGKSQFLDGI